MSCRQVRKAMGENTLPDPESSDDDFAPLGNKKKTISYAGLEISDSDHVEEEDSVSGEEPEMPIPSKSKKNNRKKRKRTSQRRSTPHQESVDEVAQAVEEVNLMLGSPEQVPTTSSGDAAEGIQYDPIMVIDKKDLNPAYELKKKFGGVDENGRKKIRNSAAQLFKKVNMVPLDKYTDMFRRTGLSMSRERTEDGLWYYTYDQSKDYQKRQRAYLRTHSRLFNRIPPADRTVWLNSLSIAQSNFHVEMLIECTDAFFSAEEYSSARGLLEQTVSYLNYTAHPSFNVADPSTRLQYAVVENRPFYVCTLKYLYMLTNTACHRTALEMAKMLMNLDPTDPLAIITIIDTLALRAREHEWLIEAIAKWSKERSAEYLYNLQFSNALAHFHVLSKQQGDVSKATELLEDAIMNFPRVVLDILDLANQKVVLNLLVHPFFEKHSFMPIPLHKMCYLYAKFVWGKWREPNVLAWLTKTVVQFTEKYDNNPEMEQTAEVARQKRYSLFGKNYPEQVKRHMYVIKAMAPLVLEHVIHLPDKFRASDPVPPEYNINRYNYQLFEQQSPVRQPRPYNIVYDILATLYPHYDPTAPVNNDDSDEESDA